MKEKCSNCKFWKSWRCRIEPPKVFTYVDDRKGFVAKTFFPEMEPEGWCGKFENK